MAFSGVVGVQHAASREGRAGQGRADGSSSRPGISFPPPSLSVPITRQTVMSSPQQSWLGHLRCVLPHKHSGGCLSCLPACLPGGRGQRWAAPTSSASAQSTVGFSARQEGGRDWGLWPPLWTAQDVLHMKTLCGFLQPHAKGFFPRQRGPAVLLLLLLTKSPARAGFIYLFIIWFLPSPIPRGLWASYNRD